MKSKRGPHERRYLGGATVSLHAARLDHSPRLQRVLALLGDGQWRGTREIVMAAEVMAVNSAISELRANQIDVECRCVGRGRYEYRLRPVQLDLLEAA